MLAGFLAWSAIQSGITGDLGVRMYGGGASDPAQDAWTLSRVTQQLLTDPARPFEGNIYYPSRHSVLFFDPLLGPAVLILPLRLLSRNPVLLYNAAVLLALTLGAWGFYRLALAIHGDAGAALLAGIVIPFSSPQLAHLWHLNLLTIAFFPLVILGLLRLVERPGPAAALACGCAFALQSGTSGYHAFSALFLGVVIVAWHWRRLGDPRVLFWLSVAAAVASLLLFPYVHGFAELKRLAPMERGTEAHVHYSLDLPRDLLGSHAYLWRRFMAGISRPFFPGLAVVVLGVLGLREWRRRPEVRLWATVVVVFLLIAAGPEIHVFGHAVAPGPFAVLARWLPFFRAVRHPVTFAVPAFIALGLIASIGLHASRHLRSGAALMSVLAFAALETLGPTPPRGAPPSALPEVYRYLRTQPAGALLELPFSERPWMWWSIQHGMPIVNGGGAFRPARYVTLRRLIKVSWASAGHAARPLEYLKTWFPIRYLVLHAGTPKGYRAAVDAQPDSFVLLRKTSDGDRVYRVVRGGRSGILQRGFRDDQLESRQVWTTLRGPEGASFRVTLNGSVLGERPLSEAPQTLTWQVPSGLLRPGINMLRFEVVPRGQRLELLDLGAGESATSS